MRYMRSLNDWLGRDVRDRQNEMQAISARVDALRGDLARMGVVGGASPPPQAVFTHIDRFLKVCQCRSFSSKVRLVSFHHHYCTQITNLNERRPNLYSTSYARSAAWCCCPSYAYAWDASAPIPVFAALAFRLSERGPGRHAGRYTH